jgi:REP element-mobilizing transposase RayT
VGDFVIMPNHVHMLLTPVGDDVERNSFRSTTGDNVERNSFRSNSPERNEPRSSPPERNEFRSTTKFEAILKSIKGASAVACNRLRHRNGAFWQADSYDHIVRSLEQLCAYRDYIARNPVLARLELPPQALYRADWMGPWLRAW